MNIKSIGSTIIKTAGNAAKRVGTTASKMAHDPVVSKNLKAAAPIAIACAGGFGLLGLLNNKKRSGEPKKLEKKSGTLALAAFAAASYKKFFTKNDGQEFKQVWHTLKKFDFSKAKNILNTKKMNIGAYALAIAGVKIATDVVTKVFDKASNKVHSQKPLE